MAFSAPVSRVVVIGGGIFGVSTALHLARRGVGAILVTDGPPANGASGRSLSWINSSRMRSAEYHRLRMIGIDRYRTLATRHPDAGWLRFDGGLTWDADGDSNGIAAALKHERSIGYEAQLLTADDVAAVTPGVDPRAITPQGAIFNPGEGWVDLPSLITVLLREFAALGGELVSNAGPASVNVANGGFDSVSTADGRRFGADAVLVATGAAVPAFVAKVGKHVPDATPIALLVRTKPTEVLLRAVLNTPRVAVRPTPTGALVLDSAWSEAEVAIQPDGTYDVKESTVHGLLEAASAVLEGHPVLALDSLGVGPKPIPEDGEPAFGQLDGVSGYYVAFSHSGATLGLIAGELLADEIATGEPHPLLANFHPRRFEGRRAARSS
ncbi:FAD-binding oxidoreductase [Methylocapsa sp. S129]|uniref:NAD(P)/FAD-dependent oxidoreductase n=1 Tax=Methylocapsa sp. S129 TaxID=1641869 RepID=UPI00131D6F2A|nr:FAD-binding oxidoreductase [Methylocapsa sp. S129]